MSSEIAIEVKQLQKRYGKLPVVDMIDFSVREGEIFGFLGPNGAGKTTTIGMILGLIRPTSGTISVLGKEVTPSHTAALADVGALVGAPGFIPNFSGYDNLDVVSKIHGKGIGRKRIEEVLNLVGLAEQAWKRPAKNYSMGMKQRLGLGMALLHDPRLLILDEPTTGLDPTGIREFRELIELLAKRDKKTIFLSSHQLYEVQQVCQRMVILNKGKIVAQGTLEELSQPDKSILLRFKEGDQGRAVQLLQQLTGANVSVEEQEITVKGVELDSLLPYLITEHHLIPTSINSQQTNSLEDIFVKLTQS